MPTTYEYEKPQVKVYQSFTEVPTATVGNQPAFVFGPSYTLFRYDNETERPSCLVLTSDGQNDWFNPMYSFPGYPSDSGPKDGKYLYPNESTPDLSWTGTKVVFEDCIVGINVREKFAADASLTFLRISVTSEITLPAGSVVDPEAAYVKLKWGSATTGAQLPGKIFKVGDILHSTTSGSETGTAAILAVYDNAGSDKDEYPWIAKVDNSELITGSGQVYVHVETVVSGKDDFLFENDGFSPVDEFSIHGPTVTRDGISFSTFLLVSNRVYLQYRERNTSNTKAIGYVSSISDIGLVGQLDPGNPLAYGVYKAKLNSGNCPVFFMATRDESKDAFIDVLKKASLTEDIYQLVPLTQDPEIFDAVEAHLDEMSSPEMKRWRIAWVSAIINDYEYVTLDYMYLQVASTVDGALVPTKFPQFCNASGVVKNVNAMDKLAAGDTITLSDGTDTPITVTVVSIKAQNKIEIDKTVNVTSGTGVLQITSIKHTYTGTQYAELVAAKSRSFADRRIYNTFPSTLHFTVDGSEVEASGYFGAAACAGLCSSTLPQQPLTNMDINGIDDVPETYEVFDNYELNIMAAGGTFIIAQDMPYDRVYVRHQLSTATSEGNLLTRELSITKNVDSISYYLAETCDDLIGKYNITPELLRVVELRLRTAIDWLENNTDGGLYGPQLLEEGTEILSVAEHPVLKDHVQAYIVLNPPKPFNVLEIRLTVI